LKVSVLFPTTGRPDRAEACLRNLRETTWDLDIEIVAAVDADPETTERIFPLVDTLNVCPTLRGCSTAWNDALALATGDPIVFAADDLRFEPLWLDHAIEALDRFPDGQGLVGFNDGHWDGNVLSTHYLMTRRFIIDILGGVVAFPWYRHSFNDAEVCDRAKAAQRFTWCEEAKVYHDHWTYGDRPKDPTDELTLGEHSESQRIYEQRKAAGFPTNYDPVIED
jgi:GT2 family glycosyltransferase